MRTGALLCACLIILGLVPLSYSDFDVGIRLSNTCKIMIKNNYTSNCPSYDMIDQSFPDMKLIDTYNSIIQSETNPINISQNNKKIKLFQHACIVYEKCSLYNGTSHYWHDPSDTTEKILDVIIVIAPHMKIHNTKNVSPSDIINFNNNGTRHITFNLNQLYVNTHCTGATFEPRNNWVYELGSLIYYLSDKCNNPELLHHAFDMNHTRIISSTSFDFTESRDYSHKQWIAQIKENCIFEYGVC